MTPSLEAVRRRLLQEVERLRRRLAASETETVGELSSYDNHPADLGAETAARSLDLGLQRGLSRRLREAERALDKVAAGTYGQCDRCGGPIEAARLEAMPWAVYCRSCQAASDEEVDARRRSAGRPAPWEEVGALWSYGTSDSPQDEPGQVDYHEGPPLAFREPSGTVEPVEGWVDQHGAVLWDAVRQQPHRSGRDTALESDEY
ncbi:MAG: TraR/DksA C4-type zinc finger protein [Firmicutes bacterium]|nr:TraR/DksA C4-type zinc finger protein [Alicyclobacillaceae bacterium]MCL6496700.1 TraR/DksA C4-type zinc finger protein [Bacillota bacterium]